MSGSVPPGAPRQQRPAPAGFNPNYQQIPNSLTDNFQNMNLNRPPSVSGSFTRPSSSPYPQASPFAPPSSSPSPFSQPPSASPFGQPPSSFNQPSYASSGPMSRPGPPPPGIAPRSAAPFPGTGPPSATLSSAPPTARPSFPPTGPQPSRPMMGGGAPMAPPSFSSPPFASRPSGSSSSPVGVPPPGGPVGLASNGPPAPTFQSGPRFPPTQPPPMGPPPIGGASRAPSQPPTMWPAMGTPGASVQPAPPFPGSSPGPPLFAPPSDGGSLAAQPLMQPPPMGPPILGVAQPPRMHGMPPLPNQMTSISPVMGQSGSPLAGQSKIDPNQIPRPIPNSSVIIHETLYGNQANPPPPAISDYIVRDTGNCSPRFLRCTISQIPCTGELLTTSGMQLALLVQPLAMPHPSEDPVPVVDSRESGPVRCSRCKGYINPFMRFVDQGRRFICNLCGFTDETPRDYVCNLGPDGRRRDADDRPELCRGTVEFVATKEYMVREPMPAVYFFVVDVSMNAIQTGATAAACSSINQVLSDLPEGPRTMVGIATFDSTVHFYNLKRALQQPLMLIVPDVQDVYTPLETDVIVPLTECRQHLEFLLESIPSMFESSKTPESALGAAMKASFLAIKNIGGKLLVFQSVLPSLGIGALSSRESEGRSNVSAGDKEAHKLLQPADKTLKEMAIEFAEYQVCVDVFLTAQSYVDIASISVVPRTTGGQVYYYYPFSAVTDPAKLYNDLRWNITRPQGFEAVMRVRCSQGIQVQEYSGNFCKRIPTDVDLPAVDCDKTLMVTLKHDDKLQDGSECSFQCALLYTTIYGERRIRVSTLSLSCTNNLSNLFRMADMDSQFVCFLKQAASQISTSPPLTIRDLAMNFCINILLSYRKFCATVSSSGQLILPEALKLLPLYTLALLKSTGLRPEGRLDDRSFWISYVSSISAPLAIPLVFPRMIAIHNLVTLEYDGNVPASLPLSSEHLSDDGIYLLENGLDGLIYVGSSVDKTTLNQLFGTSSVDEIPPQFVLSQYDNPLSKKLNDVVNEIRRQRCSFLRLRVCKKGDQTGMLFLSSLMEDKVPTSGYAYVEFLVHIHRQIQMKMSS